MLTVTLPAKEIYDEEKEEFSSTREQILQLEHSLVSLSKWESKWQKPFLSKEDKTYEETIDYIRCMTMTQNVDQSLYNYIDGDIIGVVNEYIDNPMTATTFSKKSSGGINREIITAEVIYYWMVTFNIPMECQKWHLNRLLTLINVCNIKNQPTKKMSKRDIAAQNRAINAARKSRLNSRG